MKEALQTQKGEHSKGLSREQEAESENKYEAQIQADVYFQRLMRSAIDIARLIARMPPKVPT
jgi:hypothetical protein